CSIIIQLSRLPELYDIFRDFPVDVWRAALHHLQRVYEVIEGGLHVIGDLDELNAGAVKHHTSIELGDVAVGDASFDDNGALTEGDPELMQGVELQRER